MKCEIKCVEGRIITIHGISVGECCKTFKDDYYSFQPVSRIKSITAYRSDGSIRFEKIFEDGDDTLNFRKIDSFVGDYRRSLLKGLQR